MLRASRTKPYVAICACIGIGVTAVSGTWFTGKAGAAMAATRVHPVRAGDTLDGIARRYGVSAAEIARQNHLANPDLVLAGGRLAIPTQPGSVGGAPTEGTPRGASLATGARAGSPARAVRVPESRAHLRPSFERFAKEAGIRPELAMAVAWQESGWQTSVTSSTRAVGVMQLMPDTTSFVSKVLLRRRTALDPGDPASNIRMGTRFLRYLLDSSGNDLETAVASYYQGLRSVRERGPFAETRRFVANVLALARRF